MSQPRRITATEAIARIQEIEDQAIVALIRDTVERLNMLGDRLEAFASGDDSKERKTP